jgi:DNA-directed RNA polymerase
MACDVQLAKRVNIVESTNYDDPRDIYSELVSNIEEKIKDLTDKQPMYYNLLKLKITRKLIKRGIMTITYGVTQRGILEQLLSEHFYKYSLVKNKYIYRCKDESNDVSLGYKDL